MSDSRLNPYAAPQVERNDVPVDESTVLQARFFVDERFQRQIAYDLIMPGALLLTSSMLVLVVGAVIGVAVSFAMQTLPLRLLPQTVAFVGAAGGFAVSAPLSILYHIVAHQWLKRRNLRRLRNHVVLGAVGDWILESDLTELRIHTSGGIARWPLQEIWWHPIRGEFILLQAPGQIPIGIPKKCEIEPPLPDEFAKILKKRVKRLPFT